MGYVYFVRELPRGPIKIGWAVNVEKRLAQLQTANPHELDLLGTMVGGRELETELHQRFNGLRIRGEWFRSHVSLQRFIAMNADGFDLESCPVLSEDEKLTLELDRQVYRAFGIEPPF